MKEVIAIHHPDCLAHQPQTEVHLGITEPNHENTSRVESILDSLHRFGVSTITPSTTDILPHLQQVHADSYLQFLQSTEFMAEGKQTIASTFPYAPYANPPQSLEGRQGFFSFDTYTPVTRQTWISALASAACSVTGAQYLLDGQKAVYALTRPPGHHALKDKMGGYCYLNNTALASEYLLAAGASRVAIFDIDLHHGNGTQQYAWDKSNVLFTSIHADPDAGTYPYFTGRTTEQGSRPDKRNIFNFPLKPGANKNTFHRTSIDSMRLITDFKPDFLIVSAGFDTHKDDPFHTFLLSTDYYQILGHLIASANLPTLNLQEGGYNPQVLGDSVVSFLKGFLS